MSFVRFSRCYPFLPRPTTPPFCVLLFRCFLFNISISNFFYFYALLNVSVQLVRFYPFRLCSRVAFRFLFFFLLIFLAPRPLPCPSPPACACRSHGRPPASPSPPPPPPPPLQPSEEEEEEQYRFGYGHLAAPVAPPAAAGRPTLRRPASFSGSFGSAFFFLLLFSFRFRGVFCSFAVVVRHLFRPSVVTLAAETS